MPKGIYKHKKGYKRHPEVGKKIGDTHRGMKRPPGTGKKIGDVLRGRKRLDLIGNKHGFKKGVAPWNKNKPHLAISGKNNCNWKDGISPINNKIRGSIEYKLWQDSVFSRDGYCCKKCLNIMMPYKLVAHHILNFSSHIELRFAIDNGITFCKNCHKEFHKKYGKRNNNREQLEEFIKNIF